MAKPALGRGLGALLGGSPPITEPDAAINTEPRPAPDVPLRQPGDSHAPEVDRLDSSLRLLPLQNIFSSTLQPRKDFAKASLAELADSIREKGLLQPLLVRPSGKRFELIAGERRWRAAQLIELKEVPAIVREASDEEVLQMALIENLQREGLNPLEEARGYTELMSRFHWRQDEIASRVGKSRAFIANSLRLLKLPVAVQQQVIGGKLSVGHAKALLSLSRADQLAGAAQRVVRDQLNVRQTEALVARLQARTGRPASTAPDTPQEADVHLKALRRRLQDRFGTKVGLRYREGRGALEIKFYNDEDLNRILQLLQVEMD